MKTLAVVLTGLFCAAAFAQPLTPIHIWELEESFGELSAAPSSTDLVQGFPETSLLGVLNDEVLNESLNSELDLGIIDDVNGIYSWLMDSNPFGCLAVIQGHESEGFLPFSGGCPGCPGNVGQFVDGQINGYQDGILRDYARVALSVRFGFSTPTDIGAIRVIGGNSDKNGRTFHHYDVWASTDGMGNFGVFFPVATSVRTGEFGWVNENAWEGALTEVHDFDSETLVPGCTDLRLVFYCTDNTQGMFVDPWQGNVSELPEFQTQCPDVEPEDTDGFRKAFVGPIIREVDVFAPGDITPWGDIDYNDFRDMIDFAAMQACLDGSLTSNGCFRFDIDESGAIAIADLDLFEGLMTGPQ